MKHLFSIGCVLAVVLSANGLLAAGNLKSSLSPEEVTEAFQSGVKSFEASEYPQAIGEFEKILGAGVANGALYYNLGNAYFKNGEVGKSLWAYEWARYLMPRDPDVQFNWDFVQKRTADKIEPSTAWTLQQALLQWVGILTTQEWLMVFLCCAGLMWICLTVFLFRRKMLWRNSAVVLGISVFVAVFASYQRASALKHRGILVAPEITVRAAPSENATELFKLHEGTKVVIKSEDNDFSRIALADGKTGWINKNGLRRLIP